MCIFCDGTCGLFVMCTGLLDIQCRYSDTDFQYVFHMHSVYMSLLWHWYGTCHILHDISNQDAQNALGMAVDNQDLHKTGEGPNKRVAVHGIPIIGGVRSKAFQREGAHESDLAGQGLVDAALSRLDFSAGVDIGRGFGGMVVRGAVRSWDVMVVMGSSRSPRTGSRPCRFDRRHPAVHPGPQHARQLSAHGYEPSCGKDRCVMLYISILLMSRSAGFGLDMYACVDELIGLWHVLAWRSVLVQCMHATSTGTLQLFL